MSSDGERSPKRQRRESYSPASPPLAPETKAFVHPQTPPPSVHMSPTWTSQPFTTEQKGGPGSVTFPTPPSTAGFPGQPKGFGGEDGGESGQHTPAPESEHRRDGDGDAEMQDRQDDGASAAEGDVSMAGVADDAEHRRTDHERQEGEDGLADLPPAPRLYKLRTEPIAPSRPHPSHNLIELYGLQNLQASVARKDAAGNKINKLRKSYEGKVKALGLEGRSKAQVGNAALEGLVDSMWDTNVGGGATWWQQRHLETPLGGPGDDLLAKLDAAASMRPGQMPKAEHAKWKDILGFDEPKMTPLTGPAKPGLMNPALGKTAPGVFARASAPSSPRSLIGRPERANKKRRYDESSYSGYQDGFDDDGYSTGGVDDANTRRGSGAKRQKTDGRPTTKRDFPSTSSPSFNTGSMVGVRSS